MAGHQWLVWGWKRLSRCPSVQLTLIQGRYVLGVAPLARGTAHCGPGFIGQWTHHTNCMPGCTFPWLAVSGWPSGTVAPCGQTGNFHSVASLFLMEVQEMARPRPLPVPTVFRGIAENGRKHILALELIIYAFVFACYHVVPNAIYRNHPFVHIK